MEQIYDDFDPQTPSLSTMDWIGKDSKIKLALIIPLSTIDWNLNAALFIKPLNFDVPKQGFGW